MNKPVTRVGEVEYITSTKTKAGIRRIVINQKLLSIMTVWKVRQKEFLQSYVEETNMSNVRIFELEPGNILNSNSIRKKFDNLLKRNSNLPKIRIHNFRHSHVALLIEMVVDPYLIKERLGHASIKTTYDVYGHLYPNRHKVLADRMDSLL